MSLMGMTQPINASHENKHVIKPKALDCTLILLLSIHMKPPSVDFDYGNQPTKMANFSFLKNKARL